MAEFTIRLDVPGTARETFARVVDWDAHSRAIPLTRLRHDGPARTGQRFVARTSLGPLGFDDPMSVEVLRPPSGDTPGDVPGLVEIVKTGKVLAGFVRCEVAPTRNGARVEWHQRLTVPWLPHFVDPIVGIVGPLAYRSGLGRVLRR